MVLPHWLCGSRLESLIFLWGFLIPHFVVNIYIQSYLVLIMSYILHSSLFQLEQVDSSDFHVERSITIAGSTEAAVEVTFEPSHLGDTQSTLTITSSSGGDYTVPLSGHCLAPKPQGPYVIKAGGSIHIPFKNIYMQARHATIVYLRSLCRRK